MRSNYEILVDANYVLHFIDTSEEFGDQYYNGYIFDLPDIIPVTITRSRYLHMKLVTDVYGTDLLCKLIIDVNKDILFCDRWIAMPDGC